MKTVLMSVQRGVNNPEKPKYFSRNFFYGILLQALCWLLMLGISWYLHWWEMTPLVGNYIQYFALTSQA